MNYAEKALANALKSLRYATSTPLKQAARTEVAYWAREALLLHTKREARRSPAPEGHEESPA